MKVTYDPKTDAMYIYLSDKKSSRTEEIADDFFVDFSGKTPVGIEVLGVSEKLPEDEQGKLTLSLTTAPSKRSGRYL